MKRHFVKLAGIISLLIVVFLLALIPIMGASAATTATVTVNATPEYIAISSNASVYDFGVVTAGSSPNTGNAYFEVTNTSSVAIDVSINCTGWASGGTTWTYGAAGADTGRLMASSGDGGVGGSSGQGNYDVIITNAGQNLLMDGLAAVTDGDWEMELEAPSSYTDSDEQTTTVTLEAAAD